MSINSSGSFDFEVFPIFDEDDSSYNPHWDHLFPNFNLDTIMDDEEEEPMELFTFPISLFQVDARMKNINPANLPNFHGLTSKDPHIFLFEFEVICRSFG